MKDVIILMEQTSELEVQDLAAELPSDLHLVEYTFDGEDHLDGVRAFRKVDIFDFYYDWLSAESPFAEEQGFEIKSIRSGYGNIKPRLFNAQKDD